MLFLEAFLFPPKALRIPLSPLKVFLVLSFVVLFRSFEVFSLALSRFRLSFSIFLSGTFGV
jgi:hypothetical protein